MAIRRLFSCHIAILAAALAPVLAATPAASPAPAAAPPVITVNAEAKTSDVGSAKVSVFRLLNHSGTIHVVLVNELPRPQTVLVRLNEMTQPSYDLYADGSRIGTHTSAQLAQGVKIDLPPTILASDRPIMQRILANSDAFFKTIKGYPPADTKLMTAIMANVRSWSRTADARLRNAASKYLLFSPSDQAVESVTWMVEPGDAAVPPTQKYWRAITFERNTIFRQIRDTDLKNRGISALTPLDVTAVLHPGAAPYVSVTLLNQSEATIAGKLTLQGLHGTKTPQPLTFKSLGRGKSFQGRFNLAGMTLPAADQLKIAAGISVGPATYITTFPIKQ